MSWHRAAPALLALLVAALIAPPTAATATARAVSALELALAAPDFRASEAVFVRGRALTGSAPATGTAVEVHSRTGGAWRLLTTVRTNADGRFTVIDRPRADTVYQARTTGAPATNPVSSPAVTATKTKRARTLTDRATALAFKSGAARSAATTGKRYGAPVTSQRFARALLAQVGGSTSIVHGKMLKKYLKKGGVAGRLGAPVVDMTCRLLEGACVQRFQNGAIYLNQRARTKVSVAYGRTKATPIIAAALSQKGYVEPYYRGSKYGKWQGSSEAWCGIFLAWASHASGSGDAIPATDAFAAMIAEVRQRGKRYRTPKVGRMAFLGPGPNHVALVVAVRDDGIIVTIEGNADRWGNGGTPRGVHKIQRTHRSVRWYAEPAL